MSIPIYFELSSDSSQNFKTIFEQEKYLLGQSLKMLHLGAYTGHGTKWMLERFSGFSVDVDVWDSKLVSDFENGLYKNDGVNIDDIEAIYDQTVAGLNVRKFKGTTQDFFKQNNETFNFIYIDASHIKKDVEHDLRESFKALEKNGIIACDDYLYHLDKDPSLIPYEAVNAFIDLHKDDIEIIANNYQLWFKKIV